MLKPVRNNFIKSSVFDTKQYRKDETYARAISEYNKNILDFNFQNKGTRDNTPNKFPKNNTSNPTTPVKDISSYFVPNKNE